MRLRWVYVVFIGVAALGVGLLALRGAVGAGSGGVDRGERAGVAGSDEVAEAGTGGVVLSIDSIAESKPVVARYIERGGDAAFEKALLWEDEQEAMDAAFYETRSRTDREARDEWKALLNARRLEWFDADGNGELDEFEADIMNRPGYERSIAGQKTLDRFDVDRDMRIDDAERVALEAHYRSVVQAEIDALLPEYDQNGDGRLSNAERAVYQMDVISEMASASQPRRDKNDRRISNLTNQLDMDGDDRVGVDDTRLFLHHLARGSVIADLDRDGLVGLSDYDLYRDLLSELRGLRGESP